MQVLTELVSNTRIVIVLGALHNSEIQIIPEAVYGLT